MKSLKTSDVELAVQLEAWIIIIYVKMGQHTISIELGI